jgi:hypothetical protein
MASTPTVFCQSGKSATKPSEKRIITIDVSDEILDESKTGAREKLTKACESFSVYMTKNRGLWASGPFTRAICSIKSSRIENKNADKSTSASPTTSPWSMVISSSGDQRRFEIMYQNSKGEKSQQALYEFDSGIPLTTLLEKHEFSQLIAAYLTNSLPIRTALTGSRLVSGGRITIKTRGLSNINLESNDAEIYQIRRSGDLWITKLIGTASIAKRSDTKTQIQIEQLFTNPIDDAPLVKRQSIYFLHQISDKEANLRKIDDSLKSRMGSFFAKFLNIGRSAYLGIRYGVPMQKGTGVLANVNLIGIFGEFRGGVLSGLRVNYDTIPTQKSETEEFRDVFSWSRIQLGYGFGLKLNNPILNWVDISPRLGVTNLTLTSTPNPGAATDGYEFKLQRAPTVGLEVGLEKRTNAFLIRLWGYGSYSLGVLPIDKEYKSTSIRAGVDVYREIADWKSIKLALLVFSAVDQNHYTRLATKEELSENPNLTTQVKFGSFFGGGGITLTW